MLDNSYKFNASFTAQCKVLLTVTDFDEMQLIPACFTNKNTSVSKATVIIT